MGMKLDKVEYDQPIHNRQRYNAMIRGKKVWNNFKKGLLALAAVIWGRPSGAWGMPTSTDYLGFCYLQFAVSSFVNSSVGFDFGTLGNKTTLKPCQFPMENLSVSITNNNYYGQAYFSSIGLGNIPQALNFSEMSFGSGLRGVGMPNNPDIVIAGNLPFKLQTFSAHPIYGYGNSNKFETLITNVYFDNLQQYVNTAMGIGDGSLKYITTQYFYWDLY